MGKAKAKMHECAQHAEFPHSGTIEAAGYEGFEIRLKVSMHILILGRIHIRLCMLVKRMYQKLTKIIL